MPAHYFLAILVIVLLLHCVLFFIVRPRSYMNLVRKVDQESGCLIIVLGAVVLIFGSFGFALLEQPATTQQQPVSANSPGAAGTSKEADPALESERISPGVHFAVALYETFQIFAFNIEHHELEQSGLLITAMLAAVCLATLVAFKGISALFHKSYQEMYLFLSSQHIVICGLGRIGRQLLADLQAARMESKVVVIEPDRNNKNVDWARNLGAVVLFGDATHREVLETARVHRASEVFVVTGSDESNIESTIEIRDILKQKGRRSRLGRACAKLRCHVHILSRDLADIVREKSLQLEQHKDEQNSTEEDVSELIDVEVFSALERTARRLLEDIASNLCLDAMLLSQAKSGAQSHQVVHYFQFGFGEFGQTLALKLAELSHFPSSVRPRMSIFDEDIAKKANAFDARYPAFRPDALKQDEWEFEPAADDWESKRYSATSSHPLPNDSPGIDYVCNARFHEYSDISNDEVLNNMIRAAEDAQVHPVVLVCFEKDRENFARAERLRKKLDSKGQDWPIFVWIPRQRELSQLISEQVRLNAKQQECRLIPFGQCYGSASYDEVNNSWMDWLARHYHLIHLEKLNKYWTKEVGHLQKALKSDRGAEDFLDFDWEHLNAVARNVWESRDEWRRASNRSCSVHAVLKAAAIGFKITGYVPQPGTNRANFATSAEIEECLEKMEHYRWVAERLLAGWSYADSRCDIKKTRWQITSWQGLAQKDEKSIEEQVKDRDIVRFVLFLLRAGLLVSKPARSKTNLP